MSNQKVRTLLVKDRQNLINEMTESLTKNLLEKWYPLAVDKKNGGYFTDITYDWKIEDVQHKMIVTQARHVWTASKAASFLNNPVYYKTAEHGFGFLKDFMWDKKNGGFFQMRSTEGGISDYLGFNEEKRTYGNAFGIYGLAALFELNHDEIVLDFVKEVFEWIESRAFDPKFKGYFQFISPSGKVFDRNSEYKSKAYDDAEFGFKDQNSSIHLLEAYTELYNVWHDEKLRKKLSNLLLLVRDTITTQKGYMNLFFEYDWNPVSFQNSPAEIREKNYRLDHVSFGHDYETAFLMLEASYTLGLMNDTETLTIAKKMVDHALANGWDSENGGFYDAGYYFAGDNKCTVIQNTKNWWAQAEALNILLMMSKIFPDKLIYADYFERQWNYVKKFLLDYEYGDWYEGGLDKEPHFKSGKKGHIWKCTYHTGRALMNCIKMLAGNDYYLMKESKGFFEAKTDSDKFIKHWQKTAGNFEVH